MSRRLERRIMTRSVSARRSGGIPESQRTYRQSERGCHENVRSDGQLPRQSALRARVHPHANNLVALAAVDEQQAVGFRSDVTVQFAHERTDDEVALARPNPYR